MAKENSLLKVDSATQGSDLRIFTFFVICMSLLLNQANVIFNVNLSFSDFFLLLVVIILILKNSFYVPVKFGLFFMVLSFVSVFTAIFWIPARFSLVPSTGGAVLTEYVKLIALFLYCIVGFNLARANDLGPVLKWFSIGSLVMAIISVGYTLLPSLPLRHVLFYADTRYRGLMNDPNYFCVIQAAAIVYFVSNKKMRFSVRWLSVVLLSFSILLSGSKTGMIVLLSLAFLKILNELFFRKHNLKQIIGLFILTAVFTVCFVAVLENFRLFLDRLSQIIPEFQRVQVLFTDFNGSFQTAGSTRGLAWGAAFKLIKMSPFLGTGLGTYSSLADSLFNTEVIAHNTYLQLFAEWGSVLALVFFCYLFYLILTTLIDKRVKSPESVICRNMMIPFIIGSLSLSLNNARLLWILLGALAFYVTRVGKSRENITREK